MNEYLTDKQEAVLKFIEEYQLAYGKSPTLKEMREKFKVRSDNSILKHLKALQEKGYLEKDDTPRGIKLLESVKQKLTGGGVSVPILGSIPAGGPVVTDEYVNGWMSVGEDLAKNNKDFFMLEVTGSSMIDAGIYEGDLVLVNMKKQAKDGDIVVALIDNENTLKRLSKQQNGKIYLKAENKEYEDIHPIEELVVQGTVTALIRQYS